MDSSALVALLTDAGLVGEWAAETTRSTSAAAPALAMFEAANILRRHQLAGLLDADQSSDAHEALLALPLQLWPYPVPAARSWELRSALTSYDASYVALAERLGAPVITLDARLSRASGPRCPILVPPPAQAASSI